MFRLFLIFTLCFNVAYASKGKVIFPLGKEAVSSYLAKVAASATVKLGYDPKKVVVSDQNSEGSSHFGDEKRNERMWLYHIDINNDGNKEYLTIYVGSGSLNTSGVQDVLTEDLKRIEVQKIISSNLWKDDSGDMSRFHLWLAAPSIVHRDGKYIIRFLDRRPTTLFTEYIWEKNLFRKVRESQVNTY